MSNGNFHGQPLAFALDALTMAVAELANISERRIERLVNPSLSGGYPAFLTPDGGLNSRFHAAAVRGGVAVSENKVLAHPASVDSIPTSAGHEDHVSMGNASALQAWQALANTEWTLAIELLAAAQAVEFLAPLEPGRGAAAARPFVRSVSRGSKRIVRSPATSTPLLRRFEPVRSSRRSRRKSESSRETSPPGFSSPRPESARRRSTHTGTRQSLTVSLPRSSS